MNEDIIELAGMLIILALIISVVQWLLVRYTHWSVALIVTGLVSLFVSFIYVSLENASPNGGSNGPAFSEFITPTLVIFASLLGGLALVCYLTENELPKKVIILPMCIIFVFFIVSYIFQYIDNVRLSSELFSNCQIELSDETVGKSIVNEICFENTSSGLVI